MPVCKQWRQFFTVISRREKYLLSFFSLLAFSGFIILGSKLYLNLTEIKPAHKGSVNVAIIGSPRFLNPALSQLSDADRDLSIILFSGLMKYSAQGQLIPDTIENYNIANSGKTYEVFLKKNIKWHDNKQLTANDVIFTIQTIQNPDFRSPMRALWQGIEIEKIDDFGIRFKLKTPYAPFLNNLTFGIMPKHLWENITPSQFALHELNLKPIGSGPYKFTKLQKDAQGAVKTMFFESFSDYYNSEPYLSDITFKFYPNESDALTAYRKKEIDIFNFVSAKNFTDLKNDNAKNLGLNVYPISLPRYFAIFFNESQNPILADKNVREALSYATNKQQLIDEIFGGYGKAVSSPLLPDMAGYSEITGYEFSQEKATAILAKTKWTKNNEGILEKDGKPMEIILTTIDWPELQQCAQILQSQWRQIGVKVNIEAKDTAKIQTEIIKPRQYQALLFGEVMGIEPDLFHFWHSSQKKESGLNLTLYDNAEVDALLSDSIVELDPNLRAEKNQKAAAKITEDAPAVFLFSPDYILAARNNIKGIFIKSADIPSSRFSQINEWYTKTTREWR